MVIKSAEDFKKSIVDGREVYYRGEKVEDVTNHPYIGVAANHAAKLYELQGSPKVRDMLMVEEPKLGKIISGFYKIPRDYKDLIDRHKLIVKTTELCNGVFNITQAIGSDALFALMIVADHLDRHGESEYKERVWNYYEYVARNNLAIAVAQTDVKGDRKLRPSQQPDPNLYLKVTEVKDEGIVVNGAKAHTTQAAVSNEIIVIPTRAMTESDKDYALAFAVPANARGLKMICRPILELEAEKSEQGKSMFSNNVEVESLLVFDNVIIPWERVFLFKQWQYAGSLAYLFALYHRFTAISYRSVIADILLGLAKIVAEYNGIDDVAHVRSKIVRLMMYKEFMRICAKMASYECIKDEATGIAIPNSLYTNIGKLYSNVNYLKAKQDLIDIAGGLAITSPSWEDATNPDLRGYIDRYLAGAKGVCGLDRLRVFLLIRQIANSGLLDVGMVHAEGSIEASIISMQREYNYENSKNLVKQIIE